jgi:hypothetical protein
MNFLEQQIAELRELKFRITDKQLADMIVAFVEKKDGDTWDDWSGTQRDYASVIMTDFAEFIGLDIVIPEHKPVMTDRQVDKKKLLEEMRNEVDRMLRERINELIPGKPDLL